MTKLNAITGYLDRLLDVKSFADASHNGLQVENSGLIRRVCCGVDAGMQLFEAAARHKAGLVICHHGLSWGDSLSRITGMNYRRVAFLLRHDIALYACHLPLDAHARYGNNILICKALGLKKIRRFGSYHGLPIGFAGEYARPRQYARVKAELGRLLQAELRAMDFGKNTVRSVAVVSGGGADALEEAARKGIDLFVSGESKLSAWNLAREYGVNAVFGGHYATETFGVRALGDLLSRRYRLPAFFPALDVPF